MYRLNLIILTLLFPALLFLNSCTPPATDESDIEKIKSTLNEFNVAFESKDSERYTSFFSKQFFNNHNDSKELEGWKKMLQTQVFSNWKKIMISSKVKSIDKTGYNYVLSEQWKMSALDWKDNKKDPLKESERFITFTKEDGNWKILTVRETSFPPVYKSLSSRYTDIGRTGLVYVSHITQNLVSVIDPKTNTLIGTIPSGNGSINLAFTPDNEKGYIANFHSNDITVFNKKTNEVLSTVPVGSQPTNIFITPDGQFAMITHQSGDGMWVMSTKDNQIIKRLPNVTGIPCYNPVDKMVYISVIFQPFVYVFNPADQTVTKQISVGGRPIDLSITPDGRYIYVANSVISEVDKIDTRTDSVVKKISDVNLPRGCAVTPDGKYVYITNVTANTVTVIDSKKDSVIKIIPVGKMPTRIVITKDNNNAYVSNQADASVSVIDIKKNEVIQTISVADNPIWVDIDN